MSVALALRGHSHAPSESSDHGPAMDAARIALWVALILPYVFSTAKSAADIGSAGSVGAMELVRGAGPAVLWGISIILAPTVRRGVGLPEVFLSAYGLIILMSSLNPINPNPQASLLKSASMVFVLVAMSRLVRMYRSPQDVVVALMGFVHVVLMLGILELVAIRTTVYSIDPGSLESIPRLQLAVPSVAPNPLALLGVAGILSCVLGVAPRWIPSYSVLRYALAGAYVYEIYLTRTRSALGIGLIIIAIALVIRARRRPLSSIAIFAAVAACVVVLLPSVLPTIHTYLLRGQTSQQLDSLTGRKEIWASAEQVWHEHPFFGVGYYTGHRLSLPGLSIFQSNIDNTWLETLVDVGILGATALALFCLTGLVRLLRSGEIAGDVRLWAASIAVYGLVISFINPTIQFPITTQVVLGVLLRCAGPHVVGLGLPVVDQPSNWRASGKPGRPHLATPSSAPS